MTKYEKALLEDYMNKYSRWWSLENIYYYHYGNLFGDHTPEYSRIIRSIFFVAEKTIKES
jgi:hypothetical protein